MAESYSVKAILSAKDQGFTSMMNKASGAAESFSRKFKDGLGIGAGMAIAGKAIGMVSGSIKEMAGELSSATATWKTFRANMDISGKSTKQINKVQKNLQKFAEQTIYSSSDMASTYAQLAAVGTKNTTKLVKGFGGLAAAAENPKQAMKTLSQQATQMAAKPTVAWQDFKLMVEQTPAGISAVAKQMGMSTQDLIKNVQAGTVSTEKFFNAISAAGTSKKFTEMATSYKTVGQAMDGLKETMSNKLQPAFEKLSDAGIKAVSSIADIFGKIDGNALATKIEPVANAIEKISDAFASGGINGAIKEISNQIGQSGGVIKQFGASLGAAFAVTHISDFISVAGKASNTIGKMSSLIGNLNFPKGFVKSSGFSIFAKKATKATKTVKNAFSSMGTEVEILGSKVAGSITAMGAKTETGIKIWDKFSGIGSKISDIGDIIENSLTKKISKAFASSNAIMSKAGIILSPFKNVASGIIKLGGKVSNGLTSMMGVALKAIMPAAMIGVVLAGMGLLYQQFGGQFDQLISLAQEKGPQIISNLASGISSALPGLIESGGQMVTGLLDTITANLPAIMSGGTGIITSLVSGVASAAPSLMTSAVSMIGQFVIGIAQALPSLITSGMQLLLSLAQGISANLPTLIQSAVQAVTTFISGIGDNLPNILITAGQIIATLASGLISAVPQLISAIPTVIQSMITAIMNTDWIAVGKNIVCAIGEGIFGGLAGIGGKIGSFFSGISDWFSSGKKGGEETSAGAASGIASKSSRATSEAKKMTKEITTEMSAGAKDAMASGKLISNGFSGEISSGLENAATMATGSMDKVSKAMDKPVAMSKKSGKQTGNGYASSLKSGLSKAPSIASQAVQKVNTKLRSGRAGAYSAGHYVSSGFASGMESCLGRIESAAARMVSAADKAIRSKAKIHSPSKLTKSHGRDFAIGLGIGIYDGITYVMKSTRSLISAAINTMKSAVKKKNYESTAEKASAAFQTGVESKVNKSTKAVQKAIDKNIQQLKKKNPKLKKEYDQIGKLLKSDFSSAIKSQGSKAIKAADAALTALGKKYQEKYDSLVSDRSNYAEKLSSYGELFTSDEYGYISIVDFKSQTKQVNALAQNMEKLKKVLPYDLMRDIQDMDTASGLRYTNELLKKGNAWLVQYGKDYTSFMSKANRSANSYYQPYINKNDADYSSAVTKQLKKLKAQMNSIGQQAAAGLVKGLSSKQTTKQLKKAASDLSSILIKTIKGKLKIHSPSRVASGLMNYFGKGLINGIDGFRNRVSDAMDRIISIPEASVPAFAGNFSGSLNTDYDYHVKAEYTVIVPLEINGKEFARATAQDISEAQNKLQSREERKKGRR